MPYSSVADLPAPVKAKLKGKKLRQWLHVFNSAYDRHGDESRAFAEAWATAQKVSDATTLSKEARAVVDFKLFMPIAKLDKEKRLVSGYASTPTQDSDGEIVTLDAVKSALPGYMKWGNIREMHKLDAVGVAKEANIDNKGLFLTAKIVDNNAWNKCLEGVYKGFSIGGRKLDKTGNTITEIELTEISVVDRPANAECSFTLAKSASAIGEAQGYLVKTKSHEEKVIAKMTKVIELLAKEGPQAARDGFSLPSEHLVGDPKKRPLLNPHDTMPPQTGTAKAEEGPVPCEKHGEINCEKCAVEKREFDAKEREAAAGQGQALPDGSFPIKNVSDLRNAIQAFGRAKDKAKAKAHIKSRARALGATNLLPDKWSNGKEKVAKAQIEEVLDIRGQGFLTLRKGMSSAASLSYCFDSLRDTQRSLLLEGKREGGDSKDKALATRLGTIAKQVADVISQKATHEGGEALDLSDANDQFLSTLLGEDFDKMETDTSPAPVSTGDPIADAVALIMQKAAVPSRASRLAMAQDDMKQSRKAMKECRKALEEVHKMHKASFLSKAKGGGKPKDDDGDEFDHTGAMEKLQKAYGELEKARTFGKAAIGQIEKASARSGQRGQEAGDAEPGVYEVPPGVKDLSPAVIAGASPGGSGAGGGQPPLYPVEGAVYPGKAVGLGDLQKFIGKDGQVPAAIAELVMAKAKADGELEVLRRMPAAGPSGRRPFTFDTSRVMGNGGSTDVGSLNKALFDGVDPNALNSGDEQAHTAASAKVIGNFLTSGHFGKSVLDPAFKGAAGH